MHAHPPMPPGFQRYGFRPDLCAYCSTPPNGPAIHMGQYGWMHVGCAQMWAPNLAPKGLTPGVLIAIIAGVAFMLLITGAWQLLPMFW
jgi:hypothetical protein